MTGAFAALAACGGGGGGGADATLQVDWTEGTQSHTYEGEDVPGLLIHARIDKPQALSGKTLYLIAEVQDPELFGSSSVSIDSDEAGGLLQLFGAKAPLGAKTYSGTVVVHACLDSDCQDELTVKGGRVAYQVEVKKGLVLGSDRVELTADFGVQPAPALLEVGLPDDVTTWTVTSAQNAFLGFDVQKVEDASGARLRVKAPALAMPETDIYELVLVKAMTSTGATLVRSFEIHQLTGPAGDRRWAFQRFKSSFDMVANGANSEDVMGGAMFPNGDSDRFRYVGTSYEWPTAASDNPRRDKWLRAYRPDEMASERTPGEYYTINLSAIPCSNEVCLPAGTYRAVMHYIYTRPDGVEESADQEATLTLTNP